MHTLATSSHFCDVLGAKQLKNIPEEMYSFGWVNSFTVSKVWYSTLLLIEELLMINQIDAYFVRYTSWK